MENSKENTGRQPAVLRRMRLELMGLYGLFLCAWAVYTLVQLGEPFDEAEHCHVAWLMGKLGLQPFRDFFQHHQRVLWDLLRPYFAFGGDGVEVLYFGRILVLLCATLCTLGLSLFARRTAQQADLPSPSPPVNLGVFLIGTAAFCFPELFVIRPETVSAACVVLSVWCWSLKARSTFVPKELLAGALWGLAVYASPRYLLFGGAYLLLPYDDHKAFDLEWRRLLPLFLGAALATVLYSAVVGVSWSELSFNLVFSAKLQRIGTGSHRWIWGIGPVFGAASLGLSLVLAALLPASDRPKYGLMLGYSGVILVMAFVVSGHYQYTQNFFVPIIWLAVVWAWAGVRIRWEWKGVVSGIFLCALAMALVIAPGIGLRRLSEQGMLADNVAQRRAVLKMLGPDDRVLLRASLHPICALDLSYYGMPIVDSRNRLCQAVRSVEDDWDLPECDYLKDIAKQLPAVLDPVMFSVMPEWQAEQLAPIVRSVYSKAPPGILLLNRSLSR